jgi:hypothetical protein
MGECWWSVQATWRKCRPWLTLTEFIKRTWMNLVAALELLVFFFLQLLPSSNNHRHWAAAGSQIPRLLTLLIASSSDHNFRHRLCTLLVRASASSSLKSCNQLCVLIAVNPAPSFRRWQTFWQTLLARYAANKSTVLCPRSGGRKY